jgi:hypothetical protein
MGNRRLTTETLVRPLGMVVVLDELAEEAFEVALTQRYHVIQGLSPECPDELLHVRILPWAVKCGPHLLDATACQKRRDAEAIYAFVVPMHKLRLLSPWHGVSKLLHHPRHHRVVGRGPVPDDAASVLEDDQDMDRMEREVVTAKKSVAHATLRWFRRKGRHVPDDFRGFFGLAIYLRMESSQGGS